MPLRSVEAASRDDAIAAAREQFGPHARVVGVRRVRSGGVLGFFAVERYIAEVAPLQPGRPDVSVPSADRGRPTAASSYDSPLASAAPARAGTPAPARNGAAAWAAEAAHPGPAASFAGGTGRRAPARAEHPAPFRPTADDDRLDELAGLFGTAPGPAARGSRPARVAPADPFATTGYERGPLSRATSTRVPREQAATAAPDHAPARTETSAVGEGRPDAPSPFTAALARMVSADRDVRRAVAGALEPIEEADTPASRPSLAAAMRAAARPQPSPVVPEQRIPTETGSACEHEAVQQSRQSRQEEIAEALRCALAQDSSDEALTTIVRRMLAGDSPQEALTEAAVVEASGVGSLPTETVEERAAVAVTETVQVTEAAEETGAVEETETVQVTEAVDAAASAPLLSRTASDPAPVPMALDATTVMPRISLLSPMSGPHGRGLPPVPPSSSRPPVPPSRPTGAGGPADVARPSTPAPRGLATVTRLPVAAPPVTVDEGRTRGDDAAEAIPGDPAPALEVTPAPTRFGKVVARLLALGVPEDLLGTDFAARIRVDGTYAALTHALAAALPEVPELPSAAGDVVLVVGTGAETLRAARALCVSLHLDPDQVQWATRGDLASLVPEDNRITRIDTATDRCQQATTAGTVTIVAIDAPLRSDVSWMTQMLGVWSPSAVWAVVEATRKPGDLASWVGGLPRVDALILRDTELSADPAAVLQRLTVPVALLDGAPATPHRWAALLCERLQRPQA